MRMGQALHPNPEPAAGEFFVTGKRIVRYEGRVCHLSCRRYYFKLRVLEGDAWKVVYRGSGDHDEFAALEGRIEILAEAPEVPLSDVGFWAAHLEGFAPPAA